RGGIWLGREWLRVANFGAQAGEQGDVHAGVIAREQQIRQLQAEVAADQEETARLEQLIVETRAQALEFEGRRDELQQDVNRRHHAHSQVRAHLEPTRARADETAARLERLIEDAERLAEETQQADEAVREARGRLEVAVDALQAFEAQRAELESRR